MLNGDFEICKFPNLSKTYRSFTRGSLLEIFKVFRKLNGEYFHQHRIRFKFTLRSEIRVFKQNQQKTSARSAKDKRTAHDLRLNASSSIPMNGVRQIKERQFSKSFEWSRDLFARVLKQKKFLIAAPMVQFDEILSHRRKSSGMCPPKSDQYRYGHRSLTKFSGEKQRPQNRY